MNHKIMSAQQVERTLTRLAHEIVERNRGAENVVVFGIKEAGARLAHALAGQLSRIESRSIHAHDLDVTAFRDDLTPQGEGEPGKETHVAEAGEASRNGLDVTDRDVILVDDVLFTGRTVRAALDAVVRFGRPRSIQLMVLIDRGHREYPIQPDYVGKTIPTKHVETVVVDQGEETTVRVED